VLAVRRASALRVPWRIALQVAGLLIAIEALAITTRAPAGSGALELIAIAAAVGLASALANNLPVSACATGLLVAGGPAYAAAIGLAIGPIATPQGSVATLIASELAGEKAPPVRSVRLAALAGGGLLVASGLLWLTLQ
jgi:Na+/H+ antiporter NhaD/arsenite permease-like protein